MRNYWLMKSEPDSYSFSDLQHDGETIWNGVRNNQAAIYLRSMRIGDQAFFYRSNVNPGVVGIMRIVRESYVDPGDPAGRFAAVDVAPVRELAKPVLLPALRANPALAAMTMFRQFRLSVTPVLKTEWDEILSMAG